MEFSEFTNVELELLIDGIVALHDRTYPEADRAALNGLHDRLNDEVDIRALEARDEQIASQAYDSQ